MHTDSPSILQSLIQKIIDAFKTASPEFDPGFKAVIECLLGLPYRTTNPAFQEIAVSKKDTVLGKHNQWVEVLESVASNQLKVITALRMIQLILECSEAINLTPQERKILLDLFTDLKSSSKV